MVNNCTHLSLAEVAATLGTTPLNVLMHIKRGLLAGVEKDEGWFVSGTSLDAYCADRGVEKSLVCSSGCAKAAGCSGGCG